MPLRVATPPAAPAETLKDVLGEDAWILKECARWRASRAEQQKNWAEHELANGWGYLDETNLPNIDTDPLYSMQQIQDLCLSRAEPRTVLFARELLGIAVTILNHRTEDPNPESTLAQGPVLEIMRNVIASLEHLDGDMRIGKAAKRNRRSRRSRRSSQGGAA